MATLDTITEMQKKGMTDYEISANLQSQGVSPREINEGLNQAKVKNAISDTTAGQPTQQQGIVPSVQPGMPQQPATPTQSQGIVPPVQPGMPQQPTTPEQPTQSQGIVPPVQQPQPSITQTEQAPGEEYPPQEAYPQEAYPQETYPQDQYGTDQYGEEYNEDYYGGQEGDYTDTETITEIAEQVVAEKFKEYNKKTGDVSTFKTTIQDKVTNIEQRVKRIEDTIDKLQQAILQKIGEFGENTELIRKDLDNLHNTTSKLMNPLIDNYRELQKINAKKHH